MPSSARVARSRGSLAVLIVSCCILVGCSRKGADVTVTWSVQPPRPSAGVEIVVRLKIKTADAAPVTGAKMRFTAQMSHPGMAPIIGTVVERGAGVYETRLQLSMAGDWILVASGDLPDGQRIESSFRVSDVQPVKPTVPLP
jgi:hypothetical protein